MSFEVAGSRAKAEGPLKLAVPRGALFGETLDLLDAAGIDTSELRGPSRSLIFEVEGMTLVTMRPSDVPTYVEAGAADVGITGKDVLTEQDERQVVELLDLGFGPCTMVVATIAGDVDPAAEALRRLGVMRVATKYARIAARYFEQTGRQAEIVEVKGSIELAPLTGRYVLLLGVARPDLVTQSVARAGGEVVAVHAYADHHVFTPDELARAQRDARALDATLATTEKDAERLPPGSAVAFALTLKAPPLSSLLPASAKR